MSGTAQNQPEGWFCFGPGPRFFRLVDSTGIEPASPGGDLGGLPLPSRTHVARDKTINSLTRAGVRESIAPPGCEVFYNLT